MDFNKFKAEASPYVGIPYSNINWVDIEGQPFGTASNFNAIIFKDADNIIDVSGAMAVGGNFSSPRGMSVAFGNDLKIDSTDYSPDAVRFLVGGNINVRRALVVVGHVVGGGGLGIGNGSTYLIGKSNSPSQFQELQNLYQANGGSVYWKPSDKGNHYLISSYDVGRYIPAERIGANLTAFFQNAWNSISSYKQCIEGLQVNGKVIDNFHEWILRGDNPHQNVFYLDFSPNGLINKGIRAEVPEGSLVIVRLRTGDHAHLQYGLYGEKRLARNTLYVFEDAKHIHMELSSDIWGSILAPQAMFHAHKTGGHVSGNVALNSFAVSASSGFEFHYYPFIGGIICNRINAQLPEAITQPPLVAPEVVQCPTCPEPQPCPSVPPCPEVLPCPTCPQAPPCPEQQPCPPAPSCPEPQPCPPAPPCPEPQPCPECPPAPSCPEPVPCPSCPECPNAEKEYIPYPVPVPLVYKEVECCPKIEECKVQCDLIMGCVWPNDCCKNHKWEVKLYLIETCNKKLLYCEKIDSYGCFKFNVPYNGTYLLCVCPIYRRARGVKPLITLNNVGVEKLIVDY